MATAKHMNIFASRSFAIVVGTSVWLDPPADACGGLLAVMALSICDLKNKWSVLRTTKSTQRPELVLGQCVGPVFGHRSSRQQEPHCLRERDRPVSEPTRVRQEKRRTMCSDLGQGSRICAFYSFTGILFTVSFRPGRILLSDGRERERERNGR